MHRLCESLRLPFDPALLKPYEGARMTDGVTAAAAPVDDPNFRLHRGIEPDLADAWQSIRLPIHLSSETVELASSFGYDLPNERKETRAPRSVKHSVSRSGPETMTEETVDIRGLNTCLCVWGRREDRPVVLIVHGVLDHGGAWDMVAKTLAARGHRVVAPDLRGHGRSAHLPSGVSYHFIDFVAELDALAQRFSAPTVVVGHSMGAAVAAAYAAARPARVRSLILVEPPLPGQPDADAVERLRAQLETLSDWAPHPVFATEEIAIQALQRAYPRMPEEMARAAVARLTERCDGGIRWRWDARLRTRSAIAYDGSSPVGRNAYLAMFQAIRAPLTLVYGDRSEVVRRSDVEQVTRGAAGARTIWLPGGHNLHHDAAKALADVIDRCAGSASEQVEVASSASTGLSG
jgi:pimeloyl-ACP methyl ester carboxylesterase